MSEGQDVTSKKAPAPCPSQFEEIKASLRQAVHPTSCGGHPYPDAEVPQGCENSFREPLPIIPWNNVPWKWETGPQTLTVSRPTGTFWIFFSVYGQSNLVMCCRAFCRAFFVLIDLRCGRLLIIFPSWEYFTVFGSSKSHSYIYISIYLFIHSFILLCRSFNPLFSLLNLSPTQANIVWCLISFFSLKVRYKMYTFCGHIFLNYMIYVAHFTFYYLFRSLVFHYLYVEDLLMLLSVWLICCFSLLHDTHGVHLPHLTNPLSKGEVIKLALLPITCIVLQRNSSHHASLCNCENFSGILTWERGHSQVFGSAMMPFFFF